MTKLKKSLFLFTISGAAFANAQLSGELGVLDLAVNNGNNPATGTPWQAGDQYRLVFVTSTTTDASSTDVETYNSFVQGVANAAKLGGTWKIAGSTATVDARDNTGTNPDTETGVPVFLMDGASAIAVNNAELWNGIDFALQLDENGALIDSNLDRIYTGSDANGIKVANGRVLGGDSEMKVRTGRADFSGNRWMIDFNVTNNQQKRVFAISAPLTVSESSAGDLTITEISLSSTTLTLTWNSIPDREYLISLSTDLVNWGEPFDDGLLGEDGDTTTANYTLADFPELDGQSPVFFRVEEVISVDQ